MALGKPVICSRTGDLPIVLEEGRNGLLIEADNPHALVDAIEMLVSSKDRCETFARRARKRIEEAYSITSMAWRLRDIYRQTAARDN